MLNLSKDKIANIRISCGFILNKIKDVPFKEKKINSDIEACIQALKKDIDVDVINAVNGN